ncbi:PREDICTED: pollen-specific leucine-rich repeat extensin-like protein 2 isoform X2 [Cyprinodon variegatus]|uniref:pollen-specific leucine-rich repeat extensin-like protein 2 isoform X2 n=1 Tax=Cyprinodon variegatus TaxID=28743 RepID=UPI000742BEE8|nr:PREDICTED: pollen-specific leucine-rich repeat extensin-like protein 2 isoform X2 [Cyprinodon variegatus]
MTREEDLIRIAKKLDKMVSRNNTEGAVDLLKELKGFNMTLKLLQETRIGMSVNSIRKHCRDEDVVSLAKVLIKEWKRLLDSGNSHAEKSADMKNGLDSGKPAAAAANSSSSETQSSHRRLEAKLKHESDPDKNKKESQNENHINKKRCVDDPRMDGKHPKERQSEKHLQEIRTEKQMPAENPKVEMDNKKQRHSQDLQSHKHKSDPSKNKSLEELKKKWHVEQIKTEKPPEELKKCADEGKKDKNREDGRQEWPVGAPHRDEPPEANKLIFERRGVLDSSLLYPTRFPSPPRPARPLLPIKRPSLDSGKERKEGKDSSSRQPHSHGPQPASLPPKRPAVEVKKERKVPPDPNAPIPPLPFHLHPPPPRKEPPDPNAPLPPLPLHLHPPAPPQKHPSVDGSKERDSALIPLVCSSRKSSTEPKKKSADCLKKDRRDSDDGKTSKKLSDDAKRERKDSSDSKAPPSKKVTSEVKKEKHRKDPSDLKPCHPAKGHSTELKHIRRESTDSKRSSSPPAKKITAERRESLGSKPPGQPLRKSSTDSIERKGKIEAPRTPTTPTSPMSPSFNSPGGPLPPHLATGDSVRDKCIEMLAAALRTDNDYKDFGANCDSMAAEIEDHIYQEIRATDMKYKNRVRSRISNLKDPKNPGLRRNVLAGSIELSRMASMSAEEMASDELKQLRNVLTQEAIREHQMAKTGGTTTDLLQCGKCKKKNCTYNQVQTRSADEPMTTFVLCNECGNRWKFC